MTCSGHCSFGFTAVVQIGIFILWILSIATATDARAVEGRSVQIKLDQVGYLTESPKLAIVTAQANTFEVKRSSDDETVFKGELSSASPDADTGDSVQIADFSKLKETGTYYLDVSGVGKSWTFSIRPDVFSRTYYLAMRGFYGQRCGVAVDLGPEFPGFTHPACHLKGEFHASSGKQRERDNVGGWHDAGDYGRYVVNSGISTGTVLWTWEIFGAKLKNIKLNIPESGNGTPDILNEARWNLEWMLKMQDDDGGAWHKQTSEHFPGFVMPEDDLLPSEVIGTGQQPYKSTCATADLAAVAAIAARVYSPFDAKFAAQNLEAARKAWLWTEKFPNVTFKNPPGISTGEYGDNACSDERLWAAAELWRTTRQSLQRVFRKALPGLPLDPRCTRSRRVERSRSHGALDVCLGRSQGLRRRVDERDSGSHGSGLARNCREHQKKCISRQLTRERLCLGLERRGRKLRHGTARGQCADARSQFYRSRMGQSALPAGP